MANFFDQFDEGAAAPPPQGDRAPLQITVRPPQPQQPALDPRARDLAIRTIYGEASDQGDEGQSAVAHVIRNRVQAGRYGGRDVSGVVLAPNQFEPWSRPDARSRMLGLKPGSPEYERIGAIVDNVFGGNATDPTQGSTHFFSPGVQSALGRRPPTWATGTPIVIGGHSFFAPEGRVQTASAAQAAPTPQQAPQPQQPAPQQANFFDQFDQPVAPRQQERQFSVLDLPMREDIGQGRAAFEAGVAGATAGFRDELYGASEASGLPWYLGGFRAPIGAARYGYEQATGQPSEATRRYEEAVRAAREWQQAGREQYPVTSAVSEIGGAVVSPVSRVGGTGATAIRTGARQGAAYGALSGAGEGTDLASRLRGVVTGGLTGGAVGAAAQPLIQGAGALARGLVSPITSTMRGAVAPEAEAARRAATAITADTRAGVGGLTPEQIAAARAQGIPVAAVDMGGPATQRVARSAADTSVEALQALRPLAHDRFQSQSPRLARWLNETFDYPQMGATRERLTEVARRANDANYRQAYREGVGGIWNDDLAQLVQAPAIQEAFNATLREARNRAASGRGGPMVSAPPHPAQIGEGPLQRPTLEFWDLLQRRLRDASEAAGRAGRNSEAADLSAIREQLNAHLDHAVPSFQRARQGAFGWFGADNALQAGENFAQMSGKRASQIDEARSALAQMSPQDRRVFEAGFVSNLISKIEARGDNYNIAREIFGSQFARRQIELAIGRERTAQLAARLNIERVMHGLHAALGGSQTSGNLGNLLLAGGYGAVGTGYGFGDFTTPSAAGAVIAVLVRRGVDQRVASRVGQMLASNDPAVIDRLANIVQRNQTVRAAFERFVPPGATARVAAERTQEYLPRDDQQPSVGQVRQ